MRHHRISPGSLELVEVDHHVGTILVILVGARHHANPVANLDVAKYLMVAGGIEDVVTDRVAASIGKQDDGGVGAAHARQSIDRLVALGRFRHADRQVGLHPLWLRTMMARQHGKRCHGYD